MVRAHSSAFVAGAVLLVAAGPCRADPPRTGSNTSSATPAVAVSTSIAALRSRLDRVRAATARENLRVADGHESVQGLVGMSRDAIHAALGEPHTCSRTDVHDSHGTPMPVAPCASTTDWFYSFYHLPVGSLGGGPELLLTFDAAGICTSAVWRFTR